MFSAQRHLAPLFALVCEAGALIMVQRMALVVVAEVLGLRWCILALVAAAAVVEEVGWRVARPFA